MRGNRRLIALVAVLVSSATLWAAPAQTAQNIVVIGWDGAQRDHVKELLATKKLPVLAALAKEGKMVDIDVTDGATDTKAGWTQILTGYRPEVTGVYSNSHYQPIPVGYSVFERLQDRYGKGNIWVGAIVGKKGHVDADAPKKMPLEQFEKQQAKQKKADQAAPGLANLTQGQIVEEDGRKYALIPGKPWYNASSRMDLWINGLSENERVGQQALETLGQIKDRRFFLFVHFAQPDHAGHRNGENSQEYSDAIADDDAWTGNILARLKDLGISGKTLVYVVVDHGFNEDTTGHRYAPYVFLATNDKAVNRDGDRMDIAPTLLKRMGVDLAKVSPALDGKPLDEPAPRKIAPAEGPNQAQARPKKKAASEAQTGTAKARAKKGKNGKKAAAGTPSEE